MPQVQGVQEDQLMLQVQEDQLMLQVQGVQEGQLMLQVQGVQEDQLMLQVQGVQEVQMMLQVQGVQEDQLMLPVQLNKISQCTATHGHIFCFKPSIAILSLQVLNAMRECAVTSIGSDIFRTTNSKILEILPKKTNNFFLTTL